MNKLLGIDIDTIIKKVLNETLGKEQEMQDKKSEEMKDFKEDMIVEEEILKLHYEMTEKYDTKPHFAW